MLEEHVAFYLQKYLGNYVKGLSKEALKISAWQGNVELTNMQLKPEALNALKLPVKVKAGFLGSVKLQVPWSKLGKEPVIVLLDRIFVLAEPQTNVQYSDDDTAQEEKRRKIQETESALLEAKLGGTKNPEEKQNSSWLGSLINTIIGNLKLSITNIHIRYEDSESHPGHPFSAGLTLKKLAAVTVDENGKETFISSGPLDQIQKAGELQGLALYLDPDTKLWKPDKPWEKMPAADWSKIFEPGIDSDLGGKGSSNGVPVSKCHYLLQPVGASARYKKSGGGEARAKDKEMQKATLRLHDVTLSCSQAQYRDVLKLGENFSTLKKRMQNAHCRPRCTVLEDCKAWWKYAFKVIADERRKASGRMSWDQIVRFTRLRKKYISLYINCLQASTDSTNANKNKEIQELERDVDVDVAVQWRMLGHSYVDKSRKKDEDNKKQQAKGGFLSFMWGNQSSDGSNEARNFSEEDWKQLNDVIGYQETNESSILPGQDPPDMLHTVLEVHMQHNATKLVDDKGGNILELSAEDMQCNTKLYGEMKFFDVKLGSYKITSPEGLLAESESEQKAIGGEFTLKPLEKDVDWSLSAKASPCYITYLKSSIDQVQKFFQNSDTVSQTVVLETAAALQATFGEVAQRAQQQFNEALKQKPRFSLYLDIAAPKVMVPSEFYPDGKKQSKLLLDLGYLTLQTEESNDSELQEEIDLYMRFKMGLSDVQVFLVDGKFAWRDHYNVSSSSPGKLEFQDTSSHLMVLERCGITVALQQICVPHPAYPATRVAVRLPSLGFQFSPARYHRLMQVFKVFESSSSDEEENAIRPWDPADFEGDVSVLVWQGVGNREAVWQRSYAALASSFLYILDSPSATSYKRRVSFYGKQVLVVPPESIGGVANVLAVYEGGQFNNKVAESTNTLLLRLDSEELTEILQGRIQGAMYRSSAPAAVSGLLETSNKDESDDLESQENVVASVAEKENVFLTGALDELKIVISSGPKGGKKSREQLLLVKENPLIELRALGSKVELVMRKFDTSVGAVLQALEIEDMFSGKGSRQRRYLACSDLDLLEKPQSDGNQEKIDDVQKTMENNGSESKVGFCDTDKDLRETENDHGQDKKNRNYSTDFYDAEDLELTELPPGKDPPKFERMRGLLPDLKDPCDDSQKDSIQEDFVKAQVVLFSLDSPAYNSVDKQITVSLATFSFFCIRPTLLALLNFTDAITADVSADPEKASSPSSNGEIASASSTMDAEEKPAFERKDSVVKGLLGSGKDRTMFALSLNMRQAVIILNTETGGQLASLAQEDLSCNINVFPSSFSIAASLGNLKVSDGSVEPEHPYTYICDTRSPGSTSFIKLEFTSFSKDDNDYKGYEYSLVGKLSEIRFIYLNRFIQEISAYFMGLVPQKPGYVVKIDNKVTDVEKLFTQSEVEGSPAIKLDISLSKPILLMPRETHSNDFLELDVMHIRVVNTIKWIGGEQDNPGAVRLDTTVLHVEDIHLSIGVNGEAGEGLIKKASGLSLTVTRSLRDLWHQVPGVDASIKIEELKADMSDKEYQVITECALSNLAEQANVPPPVSLKDSDSDTDGEGKESEGQERLPATEAENKDNDNAADKNSQDGSWITMLVTAEIALVELSLFKGATRERALATAQVSGVWVAYKANSIQESFIMASLNSLLVKDDREGTEPALQHMIGKADDGEYRIENSSASNRATYDQLDFKAGTSPLTMLVMDAKLSPTSQTVSLRVQQPKVLVAVDFLLAIAEFFVPSLHTAASDSDDVGEDPLNVKEGLYLEHPEFRQERKEMVISPKRPLVADKAAIQDYVYDGKNNVICLQNEDGSNLDELPSEPLIFIGNGKHLRFQNVIIQNGDHLDSCIFLGINSSYSVLNSDRVYLKGASDLPVGKGTHSSKRAKGKEASESKEGAEKEIVVDLQAIGPELTFYDSMSGHLLPHVAETLIRAKLNVFSRLVMKGEDMEVDAKINGLSVEASSGLNVVEPVSGEVKYSSVSGKQNIHIDLSDILVNFSFSVLQLVLRLQEDISSFLRITTKQTTVQCYQFDKIWTLESNHMGQRITFWRAKAPPGFAVLGDTITPSDEPLANGVLALNISLSWFKKPVRFEKVWFSAADDPQGGCSVWMPIPPSGYVSFGCVAVQGMEPPPLLSVVCILERVVTSSSFKDCIVLPTLRMEESDARSAFVRVDNSVGSFFVANGAQPHLTQTPFELLHVAIAAGFPKAQKSTPNTVSRTCSTEEVQSEEPSANMEHAQSTSSGLQLSGHLCEAVAGFKLVWWNKGYNVTNRISIWRPILPSSCFFVGDFAIEGYEPPSVGLVIRNQQDDALLKKPLDFVLSGHIKKQRALNDLYFWLPSAPPGYTALGCIATESDKIDPDLSDSVKCIRNDLLVQAQYNDKLWSNEKLKRTNEVLSLWVVENEMGTFFVQKGLKSPPRRLARRLAELQKDNEPDNLVVDAELKTVSAVIYDDFRGLMIPLLNVSLSGVNATSHGRMDALSSTLNFSLTAMTYNGKCHAWEPLIEPFDGIVRHTYKSGSSNMAMGTASELRVVSKGVFNANLSVANLNMMLEAYASWNALSNLMESSKGDNSTAEKASKDRKRPALEFKHKKSFEVTHHNKLGEDLLIRCVDVNGQLKILSLQSGHSASIQLPTSSSILDPSLKVNIERSSLKIVTILLGSAEICHDSSFKGQKYMAIVRIVPQLQSSDSCQLDQQSARTRCAHPEASLESGYALVKWNEVFACEMKIGDSCTVEIMVTELATGATIGSCSFTLAPNDDCPSMDADRKGDSRPVFDFKLKWKPLKLQQEKEDSRDNGKICYGIFSFPVIRGEEEKDSEASEAGLRPGTIQVSHKNRESWREIGLNYAATASCWRIGQDTIATETILDDVHKEITFRSLVVVMNSTEFIVDVALFMKGNRANASSETSSLDRNLPSKSLADGNKDSLAASSSHTNSTRESFQQDEIFENERYQPVLGWGSRYPGHFLPTDPKRWSNRDYSSPMQEFPEALLPLGWEWIESWRVDKSGSADEDGWSYAFDFSRKDNWPSQNNSKGSTKFVRRRRWIRSRKCCGIYGASPYIVGTLNPEESTPLPIASLRSGSPDYVIKIRPQEAAAGGHNAFGWSDLVLCKEHSASKSKQKNISEVSLHSLIEAEELVSSSKEGEFSAENPRALWFVFDVKARERGINSRLDPLEDWQIEIMAPLMLHNYLPVSSEFTVLEKGSGGNLILKEKGVIESGEKAYLYNVDIRQALYLSWIPQGGWQPEEVPVLISHPFKQAAKYILLKHFTTKRCLHVLVDHSSNGKDLVSKRVRLYVPCWLDVKKFPPLHCNFTELKQKNRLKVNLDSKTSSNLIAELIEHEEMEGQYTMVSNFNQEKMGMSVALAETDQACFPPPTSLEPLSQADSSVELRALDETGSRYYKILASTKLCPYPGIPTKILLLRPYITFTNRLGVTIMLKQTSTDEPKVLEPSDWRINFPLPVTDESECLQVRLNDTEWSVPFSIKQEGKFHISMRQASSRRYIRAEVRGYEEGSRFLVVFRQGLGYGPYRLENRMQDTELQYRQKGFGEDAWQILQPCSVSLFAWESIEGEQFLEVLKGHNNISDTQIYDINKTGKHYHHERRHPSNYYCEVLEVGSVKVVRFCEFSMDQSSSRYDEGSSSAGECSTSRPAEGSKLITVDSNGSSSQMEVQLELAQLGVSVIDLKLRELIYLCMDNVSFTYATGYAGKSRRLKFLLGHLQLDNQLPFAVLPVVLVPEDQSKSADPVLKLSVTIADQTPEASEVYPYIGLKMTKSAWRVNIHEPIIWAILDFYNDLNLDKMSGGSDVGQVDPELRIDLIDISEVKLKLTVETAPRQRPRGLLGIWSPFVTALGNTSKMPIHLRSVLRTNRYMRKSAIVTAIVSRLRRDLIHNPLMLLSGVDVLGMTSSTLATLSETVAELSNDGKFLQLRSKLDRSRRIGGVSDGLVQGTEAIAQGVAYGLSGVIRKPLEKAKERGFVGFFQGLGKGAIGAVMEPVSGVLDFVSLTVNGVGASCTKCFELFERRRSFERVRLPRYISRSGVLCSYNEKAAIGKYTLQNAEGKGRFRQGVFLREPSKFAWSDMYVDHFEAMNHKIVMLTSERVILLQCPKSHFGARLPLEPSFILWDVPWLNLLALELAYSGIEDSPTYAVLHLRNQPTLFAHLIKCCSRSSEDDVAQVQTLLACISKLWKAYGPSRKQVLEQMGVKRQPKICSAPLTSKMPVQSGRSPSESAESRTDASSSQSSVTDVQRQQHTKEIFHFMEIWTSEQVAGFSLCVDMVPSKDEVITIWRPIIPEGYVSVGDIVHIGKHPPLVSVAYLKEKNLFVRPTGFDLLWRSWKEKFVDPMSLWMPKAPDGYFALGCVAVAALVEPDVNDVWCVHSSLVEDASFEEQEIWHSLSNSAWGCYLYQVASEPLTFMAMRQSQQRMHMKPKKVVYRR